MNCNHKFSFLTAALLLSTGAVASCAAKIDPLPKTATSSPARIVISNARPITIILPAETIASEETAAEELKNYLTQITGARCQVAHEGSAAPLDGTLIYLGPTEFAAGHLGQQNKFGDEEWLLQNIEGSLVIDGGRPRGTLYGAYHFLEDVCGVRWWSRWEESVPRRKQIEIDALQRREKPVFSYREIYREYHGPTDRDGGRTAARARLDCDGDVENPISPEYGGANNYGPPRHTHTVAVYINKATYFAAHPEWFALVGGKRIADPAAAQLDYTDPNMRVEFLRLLKENIRKSQADAIASHLPPPTIYAVDQSDATSWCQCPRCAALVKEEGSQSGPIIDFVNYMAAGIRDEFPDVALTTLAYQATEVPPKTLRPASNVIVKLTDTTSDYTDPVTARPNQLMHDRIVAWEALAPHLQIWKYSTFYTVNHQNLGFPFPSEDNFATDYRFYQQHHVNRVFVEFENTVVGDGRDLKLWLMSKLLENPQADDAKLIKEFTDGFYGPAGPYVLQYRHLLRDAAQRNQANLRFFGSVSAFSYLKLNDVLEMHRTFDAAERAVSTNPVFLRRVHHARLSLDRLTLFFYPAFLRQHEAAGGTGATLPLDRAAIAGRALQTWTEQAKMRLPADKQQAEIDTAEAEIKRYQEIPKEFPLPEQFKAYSSDQIIDLPAAALAFQNNAGMKSALVDDADAPTGKTEYLNFDDQANKDVYALPMKWGFYNLTTKKDTKLPPLKAEDIVGPGYHWYKMGTVENLDTFFAYFTVTWNIQCSDNHDAIARSGRNGRYEVWANMKFEGPMNGSNGPGQKNALSVERVILTPAKP